MRAKTETKSKKYTLKCASCSAVYEPEKDVFSCQRCKAPTVVALDLEQIKQTGPKRKSLLTQELSNSLWKYFAFLPLEDPQYIVSQGEGRTPLLSSSQLADRLGVKALLLKNETVNPTGSFKDRQITLSISKMKEAGAKRIAVVSSGNVAASAASYSAVAEIECKIFAPSNAPEEKLVQARMYGASFYGVNTLSSSRIFSLVQEACRKKNWRLLSTAGLYNPYQVEGAKTIAYELSEQVSALPDWIFAPVGGGGLLGALWRGFSELIALGRCQKMPHLVGVQSAACTPLVDAIEKNLTPADVIAHPVEVKPTIAGAIADDVLFDAYTVIPAIRSSGGLALSVTDDEMLEAEKMLARYSGIFAEPASASTVAAVTKLRNAGTIKPGESVCCIITGSGFKDMASARAMVGSPSLIEPTEDAFLKLA
jgi:threonine synthase